VQTSGCRALCGQGGGMNRAVDLAILGGAAVALSGLIVGPILSNGTMRRPPPHRFRPSRSGLSVRSRRQEVATVRAARGLNRAAGTLAASALADSSIEHYRGSFKNRAMVTPLIVSAMTLATSIHGTSDMRPLAHKARDISYLLAAGTGLLGTGFHFYNVGKRVGGFCCQNVFYGAPL